MASSPETLAIFFAIPICVVSAVAGYLLVCFVPELEDKIRLEHKAKSKIPWSSTQLLRLAIIIGVIAVWAGLVAWALSPRTVMEALISGMGSVNLLVGGFNGATSLVLLAE